MTKAKKKPDPDNALAPREYASRAIKAGNRMHLLLTEGEGGEKSMMDTLYEMFCDTTMMMDARGNEKPTVSVKEKLEIVKFFADQAKQREMVAMGLGLTKREPVQQAKQITNNQFNVAGTLEERLKEIEETVRGIPTIQPKAKEEGDDAGET